MGAITKRFQSPTLSDAEVVRFAAGISVWGRWLIWTFTLTQFAYRPGFWYDSGHLEYFLPLLPPIALNGLIHYRLLTNRSVTWRWLLLLSAVDMVAFTVGVVFQRGFEGFLFLAYYPSLALFVVVFPSLMLALAWTTITAAVYTLVCLNVGRGLDFAAGDEKELLARVTAMYAIVLAICLVVRFDRTRRQAAVERERHMQRERIELSQSIHDTTAQTVYMISLGLYRSRELADESNKEQAAVLDATSILSKSAMWELRRPIDAGHIFEGRALGQVLWSHCATFQRITAITTQMSQSATEPPLSMETRARLFSIAHNALTNAFMHARPSRVDVRLDFGDGRISLSVSDDGVGLPDDYAERGRGFNGMRADAAQMGGTLVVESGQDGGGATITCVVPHEGKAGGA